MLSDTQLLILSAASQRPDHAAILPPNLKGGIAKKVIDRLLKQKLLQELHAKDDMPVWRRGDDILRKRNILFTAITRSRGWVCVSGVGDGMASLVEEYQAIKSNNFELEFDYPTSQQLQRIRTLHRDRSSDEMHEIEQDLEGLARLIHRVDSGQISLDALPIEAQAIIRRMKNERPKPANLRRKPD